MDRAERILSLATIADRDRDYLLQAIRTNLETAYYRGISSTMNPELTVDTVHSTDNVMSLASSI